MAEKMQPLLRYRKRAIALVAFYLPILIVPWVLTCVLMFRPISLPSYINQQGEYSMTDMRNIENWVAAVNTLSRIAATLGLPIVSAVLAQAVIVYSQLRKKGTENSLSVLQLFALSDRGWMDPSILLASCFGKRSQSSMFLWFGAALILLTAVQPPLQTLLVPFDHLTAITCNDNPVEVRNEDSTCDKLGLHSQVVGTDPEPNIMEHAPRDVILSRVRRKLKGVTLTDVQSNLWHEDTDHERLPVEQQNAQTFAWLKGNQDQNISYFVSSLNNGTTTGVLRQHALRLNTTIECEVDTAVPSDCAGSQPFFAEFNHTGRGNSGVHAQICVEGNSGTVPWSSSRNRQDITERLWMTLDVEADEDGDPVSGQTLWEPVTTFNLSCTASSTRGYFQLGNHWNGQVFEPILDEWPDVEEIRADFNDYGSLWGDYKYRDRRPATDEPAAESQSLSWMRPLNLFDDEEARTPGPLAVTAMALFGNGSFFHLASDRPQDTMNETMRDICESENYPMHRLKVENLGFTRLCYKYRDQSQGDYWVERPAHNMGGRARYEILPIFVGRVLEAFSGPRQAEFLLEMGSFFANEALLMESSSVSGSVYGRSIYSSLGWTVLKPRHSIAAIAVISVLIAIQTVCLLLLVYLIASTPTWTDHYDSFALAQLGAQLEGLPKRRGLRSATKSDAAYLAGQSGMVGLMDGEEKKPRTSADERAENEEGDEEGNGSQATNPAMRSSTDGNLRLGLGGTGLLSSEYTAAGWFGLRRRKGRYAPVANDTHA